MFSHEHMPLLCGLSGCCFLSSFLTKYVVSYTLGPNTHSTMGFFCWYCHMLDIFVVHALEFGVQC